MEGLGGALDVLAANPIVLVVIGIAALAFGIYEAYQNCAPFRNAINEIGGILEGAFKTAVSDIEGALSYLWNNVFAPLGSFLSDTFNGALSAVKTTFDDIKTALSDLWNNVLVPVANFFKGAFTEAINIVMGPIQTFENAINTVSKALSPITGLVGDLTGALKNMCFAHAAPAAEEFNKQLTNGIELSSGLTQKLDPLKQGLLGVSGSTAAGASGSSASRIRCSRS